LEWLNVYYWIQIQSWSLLAAVFGIIFVAHIVPVLVIHHECTFMPWCAVLFHVFEVPVMILFTYMSYLGFFWTTYANLTSFNTLANANHIAYMLVLFAFKFLVTWDSYQSAAPTAETFFLSLYQLFFLITINNFITLDYNHHGLPRMGSYSTKLQA
jgi:hypothetical protein